MHDEMSNDSAIGSPYTARDSVPDGTRAGPDGPLTGSTSPEGLYERLNQGMDVTLHTLTSYMSHTWSVVISRREWLTDVNSQTCTHRVVNTMRESGTRTICLHNRCGLARLLMTEGHNYS